MSHAPVAAGKSSFDLVVPEKVFALLDVQPATTVLDMACGSGRYSLALAERVGAAGTICAVDLWADGIEALNQEIQDRGISNIRTLVADISEPLPLENGAFDACLIATVLHDVSEEGRHGALREASRLLRPGGTLNVIEFKKIDRGPGPPVGIRLDEAAVESLVAGHGFRKVAGGAVGEFNYLLRFEKNG